MISPERLRTKAENLYQEFLRHGWPEPRSFRATIPANRQLDASDHAGAIAAISSLRDGSKGVRGFGYTIEWREKRSHAFGRNAFPERIYFETQEDFLRFIGKQSEFLAFSSAVERLRLGFPELAGWIASHRQLLIEVEPDLDGLLHVLRYFRANPRPGCFARELPLPVDTKFVERQERVLREWFDLVLPPKSIRSDETHFCRRYGLRYAELHVFIRFLDSELQNEVKCPWPELSLPISVLAALPVRNAEAIIVENKVNLLTLRPRPRSMGLGALGRAVSELRAVPWLATIPITYWGDLDVEGFQILSALRAEFPHTRSLLMDAAVVSLYRSIAGPGTGTNVSAPPHLTINEDLAFEICRQENLRIEQERIPLNDVHLQ